MHQDFELTDARVLELNRLLDRVKIDVFANVNGAFLSPLMITTEVIWDMSQETAATDGILVMWNPTMFLAISHKTRRAIFLHELWHIAMFHCVNLHLMTADEIKKLNYAADIWINGGLIKDGEVFENVAVIHSTAFAGMSIGEILKVLDKQQIPLNQLIHMGRSASVGSSHKIWNHTEDALQNKDLSVDEVMNSLLNARAVAEQSMGGDPTYMLGAALDEINQRLTPSIDWFVAVKNWLIEQGIEDYSYNVGDRRFDDMHLPSLVCDEEEGKLTILQLYLDTSGSITIAQETQFVSDARYIKQTFDPDEIHIIFFDDSIQHIQVFKREDDIDNITPWGGGGTSFACVRQHIMETQPKAAVVFSDMECSVMEALPPEKMVDMIWIAMTKKHAIVPHGKVHYVRKLA